MNYFDNKAIVDKTYNGECGSSSHIHLNGVDQSISYPDDQTHNSYYDVDTKATIQQTATGTTFNMTASHSMFINHDIALTANELTQIDAGVNILMDVWYKDLVLVDGFSKSNITNFFPGTEGLIGQEVVYDISV